ncbi:MAG: hypothetical protein AMS22_06190 [Thiotrichales bacterium SG8_50]|nr:MAG: hypothetical protein AMS22_06190 [Thiotrichales bacterium SG8_50]
MTKNRIADYSRLAAFAVLAVVTAYGTYRFLTGDWTDVIQFWRQNWIVIPLLVVLSVIDVALEGIAWMWTYHRFGIRTLDRDGCCAFLVGRAGLILPAQLGRLLRPDAIVRLRRANISEALKAEGVMFVLDGISVLALLAGLLVFLEFPVAAPLAGIGVVIVMVFLGNKINAILTHTRLRLPTAFWWAWPTFAVILVNMLGWVMHGLALHVVVAKLPGSMSLWDSLFMGPGSAVLGVATGLPGGIGATEGLLGAGMRLRSVPVEHLAVAVAAFRLITFWVWIPIGWLAMGLLRRKAREISR